MNISRKLFVLTLVAGGMLVQTASALIAIETVPVGNAGNAGTPSTGYGAVGYDYRIGKYEVTLNQYSAFLNAVGATDTYGLYNTSMGTDLNIAGISRSGVSGSYSYSVIGSGNRPVTYVSWFDSARFVNWLHNGQQPGLQNASTTEQGVYTLNGALSGMISRNANVGWTYGLPSENEWYKAAYHEPMGMGEGSIDYWQYPYRSNELPVSIGVKNPFGNYYLLLPNPPFMNNGYYVSQSPTYSATQQYLTEVGSFSASFYGTFDQGGNVWEWTDAVSGELRKLRGASWADSGPEFVISAGSELNLNGESEGSTVGFRVVIVPEPTVAGLMTLGIALFAWRRK
jgi:sulfatase modifying factor 1